MKIILIFNTNCISSRTEDLLRLLSYNNLPNSISDYLYNGNLLTNDNLKMFDCNQNEFAVIYGNFNSIVRASIVDNKNNELKIAILSINDDSPEEEKSDFEDLWNRVGIRLTKKG
mgnify:CR=1 FL=1